MPLALVMGSPSRLVDLTVIGGTIRTDTYNTVASGRRLHRCIGGNGIGTRLTWFGGLLELLLWGLRLYVCQRSFQSVHLLLELHVVRTKVGHGRHKLPMLYAQMLPPISMQRMTTQYYPTHCGEISP